MSTLAATLWEHIICRLRWFYRHDTIIITRWTADTGEVLDALARAPLGPGPAIRWIERRGEA